MGFETMVIVKPSGGWSSPEAFKMTQFQYLYSSISAFVVTAYNHPSAITSGGAIAPYQWIRQSLIPQIASDLDASKGKLVLALNHYGYDFVKGKPPKALKNNEYLALLQQHRPALEWDSATREHFFTYSVSSTEHIVHYPTLKSLDERINLAKELKCGVAIWDIGQGLEYFFDLM